MRALERLILDKGLELPFVLAAVGDTGEMIAVSPEELSEQTI
jgi:hypothetical protein